jgi:endo-1,4-beta-xylanase
MKTATLTAIITGPLVVFGQLHELAKNAGLLYFGTAVSPGDSRDSAYYTIQNNIKNFGQYTPDNAQKWEAIQPSRGQFSYGQADAIVNRALSNKMLMRCHTLVWYSQLPRWGLFSPSSLDHIPHTVTNHGAKN